MNPWSIRWAVRLEGDGEALRPVPLSRALDVAARADRWREVVALVDGIRVSFELGAGETTADALEAAEQDLAIEDLCFDSVAHEALARAAVKAMRAELERPAA